MKPILTDAEIEERLLEFFKKERFLEFFKIEKGHKHDWEQPEGICKTCGNDWLFIECFKRELQLAAKKGYEIGKKIRIERAYKCSNHPDTADGVYCDECLEQAKQEIFH